MFDSNKKIVYTDMLEEYHRQISSRAGGGGNQVDTIPTASSSYENKIVQYIGDTDSTYTNGYFYKCIEDPDNAGEYIWVNISTQAGESGSPDIIEGYYHFDDKLFYKDSITLGIYDTSEGKFYTFNSFNDLRSYVNQSSIGNITEVTGEENKIYKWVQHNSWNPTSHSYSNTTAAIFYTFNGTSFVEMTTTPSSITGEVAKLYVDISENKSYRWDESTFIRVDKEDGVSLGETASTAYRGDRGKIAYDNSQANKQNIGDLANLQTTAKTNLVAAINEAAQSGGGTGGGHEIEDSSGTSLTQRDTLQFAGDFEVSDDSTNEKTVVAPHELTSADMAEIMSTLPSPVNDRLPVLFDEQGTERVVGWYVNSSGLRKPVYEKTYVENTFTIGTSNSLLTLDDFSSKTLLDATGSCKWDSASHMRVLPFIHAQVNNEIFVEINIIDNNLVLQGMRQQGSSTLTDIIIKATYTKTTDTYQD